MINLLKETIAHLIAHNKTEREVIAVCDRDTKCYIPWDEFTYIARRADYDNGFGGAEINSDLIILGQNWWLERHEYDGSEWWEYKEVPNIGEYNIGDIYILEEERDE